MMPKITENCCQIDAQNALKSSLGDTLRLNFSSFRTGTWKMDVVIQKKSTGMLKMLSRVQGP